MRPGAELGGAEPGALTAALGVGRGLPLLSLQLRRLLSPLQVHPGPDLREAHVAAAGRPQPLWPAAPVANCAPKERPGRGRRARGKGCSGVPGYTGFIPKTYGEICRQRSRGPLARAKPGRGPKPPSWKMEQVAGFTSFVPRLQFLTGASFPVLAHRAMLEFEEMLAKTGQDSSQRGDPLPPLAKTYPTDRGLLPHYRGYVPGYKFQFGHTYGHLTRDALGQTTLEKQVLDVTQ